jgi:hypothetical protein
VEIRVVQAQIQTVEEIYKLVWTSVASRQPIEATYQGGEGCFARTGWAEIEKDSCVCCVINTAVKARADSNRRARRG